MLTGALPPGFCNLFPGPAYFCAKFCTVRKSLRFCLFSVLTVNLPRSHLLPFTLEATASLRFPSAAVLCAQCKRTKIHLSFSDAVAGCLSRIGCLPDEHYAWLHEGWPFMAWSASEISCQNGFNGQQCVISRIPHPVQRWVQARVPKFSHLLLINFLCF